MGDRATACILLPQPQGAPVQPLWLYTHWRGTDLPQLVAQALSDGRARWGEPSYLARILIGTIIDLETIDGYGIGMIPYGHPADAGRPQLVIDTRLQHAGYVTWDKDPGTTRLQHTYETFIQVGAYWPNSAEKLPLRQLSR